MTASVPSGAMKQTAKRPSDAKQQIVGSMPIGSPDMMANGLGKTATRSKAGCMTCRIRRKKCDLQKMGDSCGTCVRLRIGCLGWGAKRPEALRNPDVVKEIQRRIKVHLASNNMIKGSARASAAATPAPQPSSTSSNEISGGAAGGAGASYDGQSFLSFADLVGPNASSHNEAPQASASGRKGKPRQSRHAPVESPLEDGDVDGSGEEDYEMQQGDRGSDDGGSSFSRHPPGYPQPNYDPPQYRPRYPYEMGSPPQGPPYHAHAPHPYAQSDLRTRSEYDNERDMRVDGDLRRAERDRESYRGQLPSQGLPRHSYEPNGGYPPFPGNHFVYGPGVGAASAGRALANYDPYGALGGYRGPSPNNSLNSSFHTGPPAPKMDPLYSGPRLSMMDSRHNGPLPGPPLSLSMSRNGGGSPTTDQYLQPTERSTNGNGYHESGYRSPNPPRPSRSPMGAGLNSTHESSNVAAETSDEAGDIDGEPIPPQLSASTSSATQGNINIQHVGYTPNPYIPHSSSFGAHYAFDSTVQDADLDAGAMALAAVSSNPAIGQNLPMATEEFNTILASLGIETLADAPAAIEANATTTDSHEMAALSQLQVFMAPPPAMDSQAMYTTEFESKFVQFSTRQMELLHLYKNDLCNLQYHIAHSADASIADELFDLAMRSEAALFGTLTLTSLYKIRLRGTPRENTEVDELAEVVSFKNRVSTALESRKMAGQLDSGDAMAALHMVSAVLFDGGYSAEWDRYLDIAKAFVAQHPVVQLNSWHGSPVMESSSSMSIAVRGSNVPTTTVDKKTQFIIKTVAWFDVIGSVTMRRAPYFLDTYRELFGRQGGNAMERIMGCNEKVLLAIAETAALAAWRREEENKGTLNFMDLADRASKIQAILRFVGPQFVDSGDGIHDAWSEQERQTRTVRLVSNVFRATGRLYLHTVVSGCNPDVHDIKAAVQATVDAFKVLQASDFDRSLVFPITLAGCMTDDREHRSYFETRLRQLGPKGEAVGNSSSCWKLMQAVWNKRDAQPSGQRIVDWVDTMNELEWSLLLV